MSNIIPIPSTRIPGLLMRQRLTEQYQADQLDLFRLQEQLSTGQRIVLPSQDAPAALRAVSLQRLLKQKGQLETNVQSGLRFLASTDNALPDVAAQLSDIKASTLNVVDTVATQQQRDAAINEINNALQSLVALGNRKFNGRHIFAGSQTNQQPYDFVDDYVVYHGDDRSIRSFSDLGLLFTSNATGQDVFGGVSAAVEGSVDLNPELRADTLLSSLRGGRGIQPNGALEIVDAVSGETSIVDISTASTVGDVARLIEDNPPSGITMDVSIIGTGLTLELSSGNLVIREVGTGITARELGLLTPPSPLNTVTGEDLDPVLLKTTRLEDILGTKARATLKSVGNNNDILIEASQNGTALDGVTIEVVDGGDLGPTANVSYDAFSQTLTIEVDDTGDTNAIHVVDAIEAEGTFRAALDQVDSSNLLTAGTGAVEIGSTALTAGGSGTILDQTSGFRVVNGGTTLDISVATAETVEDLLNILNDAEMGLLAEINTAGNGINVRSRLSGSDFQIGEVGGGTTAAQLGLRTSGTDTLLSALNFGAGVSNSESLITSLEQVSLDITASDAQTFNVDLTGIATVPDAINAINLAAAALPVSVVAQLDATSGGILLTDNAEGAGRLNIAQNGGPNAFATGIPVTVPTADLRITAADGQSFSVDIAAAQTIGDVLDRINNDTGNIGLVTAQLAATGNGIELVDTSGGAGSLVVTSLHNSPAAEALGLVAPGETSQASTTGTLTGTDRHFLETDSVFNTLIRLRDALANEDQVQIERAAAAIDGDIDRVTFAQADVGARFQALQLSEQNLQDEVIQLRGALSEEIDADLVQVISDLTARQISLEASLRASANILQLTLLNFI